MPIFDLFKAPSKSTLKEKAKSAFERLVEDKDNPKTRSVRIHLGLLLRTHVDKLFVQGATDAQELDKAIAIAIAAGQPKPERPPAPVFLEIKTSEGVRNSYLPEEYAQVIYNLGARYQSEQILAIDAIGKAQEIFDTICHDELNLPQSFEVLRFLRVELLGES
jgi:hypothetical protein